MNFADPLNLPTECLSEKSKKETKKISKNVLGFFLLDKKKEKIMKFYLNEIKSLAQHQNI